ncbi:MAG: hypothetical protein ACR2NW_05805 [Thermodesulfobacteriota bacterium]
MIIERLFEENNMNWAHIHLMINHVPLVGIGFTILLLIIGMLKNNKEIINIALIFVILVALWAIPAYLTGEPAEELVENLPGISHQLVEEHEEKAKVAFILIEITGILALATIILQRFSKKLFELITTLTLVALIISGVFITWTANLGGKINHPEIRSGATIQNTPSIDENDEIHSD